MVEDLEDRIRRRAYQIWEREGRPEGRKAQHWELAKEEIAIEDNYAGTLHPSPSHGSDDTAVRTEPVEPVLSIENQGEVPGVADQGDESQIPGYGDRAPWPDSEQSAARDRSAVGIAGVPGRKTRRKAAG
ncbi:MAG TPA: DUF2934 domain-containing protein [Azospirillum sp.]|nr:DUF2934 domain-containing protein [Azospirillum sp.]